MSEGREGSSLENIQVTAPMIHDNGTPVQQLLDQLEKVWSSLDAVLTGLRFIAPNPRDYPSPAVFEDAREQHRRWQLGIGLVLSSIEIQADSIERQIKERNAPCTSK